MRGRIATAGVGTGLAMTGENDHFFPRMKTAALRQANLKKEAAAVEDYWSLFLETGAPEFYMLHRAREDEKCRENKEKPSPTG